VPHPDRATLGGVVAAGQSGFDRLRYGPVRNALLGARVLLADGRLAKSGGQLVKNVTGYDLHRLYCGSHGTLCVIVEASLRLHPLPEERRVLSRDGADPALARAALAAPVRHLAVWSDRARTSVALTGRAEVVAHEAGLVRAALGGDVEELDGADAEQRCGSARDAAADAELELASRRTALAPALERLAAAAGEAGLTPRALAHPGVAQAFLRFDAPVPEGARAALDASLANAGVRVAWRSGGGSAPDGDALAMMRALRDALDPDALFARGRMPGGL
jgi:glycolate oxidase FAD binding subunit